MITPDDNGYGRVKRWREKNRAYVNLKQREYRRMKKCSGSGLSGGHGVADVVQSTPPARTTIEELRELIKQPVEASTMPVVKPLIYKDDYGRVITEKQFNEIQDRKAEAERNGYEIDEYAQ